LLINSSVYLPARAFFEALGVKVTYSSSTKTLTARAPGLEFSSTDGGFVTYANGRPLFSFGKSIIMSDGRMYIPATALTKATGTSFNKGRDSVTVTGKLTPLLSADRYYQSDEVFWLARIITAEARGESLLGQIAVGNVIMNRVASRQYPSTIYGVIFDRKWGVQFSPVLDGSIYNTPTYTATLAAQICLEGVKLSEDAMFFLNPVTAESNWIVKSREYLYSIGGHDFYK
jgi:N-acetylmuramoyl-L-alanine amidase